MLTDFPRAAVEHHVQQYMELRDAEEQYLRQVPSSSSLLLSSLELSDPQVYEP